MPEYLPPGVYIDEIDRGPKAIEGVPTSTAAFVGETERGPLKPRAVNNYEDYVRWFGGVFADDQFMPFAVAGFFQNGGKRLYVCRVANAAATTAEAVFGDFVIKAVGPGLWGTRVYVQVDNSSTQKPGPDNSMVPVGVRLRVAYYANQPSEDPGVWFNDQTQPPFPSASETFDDLDANEVSPNYWQKRLYDKSSLIELTRTSGPVNALPTRQFAQLVNGSDGKPPEVDDFEGEVRLPQRSVPQGLAALKLDQYHDVALIYTPNPSVAVAKKVIAHCEDHGYRFAVIDIDKGVDATEFHARSAIGDTRCAAVYYPWIIVSDQKTGARKEMPPGGHVLGAYARTDSERGVFKSPANEDLRGVVDLTLKIDDQLQATLIPRGVNSIRSFPGRGIRVWGARTLSSDPLWKYVTVQRLTMFLEASIYEGMHWVVFEPNDDRLWARVRETIRLFLRSQWRSGALFGQTEEEAFFVRCGRETITEADIASGRLLCQIGIAAVRPSEFLILLIGLKTAQP